MVNWGISRVSRDHNEFATSKIRLSLLTRCSVAKKRQDDQKRTTQNIQTSNERNELVVNWVISQVSRAHAEFTTSVTELL